MNKPFSGLMFLLLLLLALPEAGAAAMPEARMVVKVVDEQGQPLPEADVKIWFQYEVAKKGGWGLNSVARHAQGRTDANGVFEGQGMTDAGCLPEASKAGYYQGGGKLKEPPVRNPLLNRWEPWPLAAEVVLKKMRHPVPMYRKEQGWAKVPVLGKPVGYDLEAGAWVAPLGRGRTVDFFVTLSPVQEGAVRSNRCLVEFPSPLDGFQAYEHPRADLSSYRWPFEAPETGYENPVVMGEWRAAWTMDCPGGRWKPLSHAERTGGFLFRTRSVASPEGKLVSACYGKIDHFEFNDNAISLGYWFNPDGTRNLEEDPKKNLLAPPGR